MSKSRSEYVVKNATVTLLMQVVKNVLAFVSRTVFVYVLGAEYLGVNSLFTEILTMLSFAELGIGNAMVFSLYKPIAVNDTEKIKSLMRLYEKSYRIIGIVIAALGICVIPFLRYIVGDVSYIKENLVLLYCLFLLNTVISYFFVYKKSLIIANQKNYIIDIYQQIFYAVQVIAQSVFLIITKQFITYLIIVVVMTFLNNFWVARKADKMYPYLTDKNVAPLSNTEKKGIFDNVKSLVIYKIGGIILESTDSIFISSIINVVTVGLYANYKLIINVFKTIGSKIMESIVASVGNLNAVATKEKKRSVFNELLYVNAWFYGFTATGLYIFLTKFIEIWLGSDYVIGAGSVLAACVYYFVANMHYPCYTYRTTAGLFVYGKFVPIIAAVINIILDIVLGKSFGLAGILWASTIARLVTYEVVDPTILYKRVFETSVAKYFIRYIVYVGIILVDGIISIFVISKITYSGIVGILLKAAVFTVVFNVLFFAATFRTQEFKSLIERAKVLLNKGKSKKTQ